MSHALILSRTDYAGDTYGDGSYGSGWYGEDDGIPSGTLTLAGTVSDNFNRANGALGSNWISPHGDRTFTLDEMVIVSNKTADLLGVGPAAGYCSALWADQMPADQEISATVRDTIGTPANTDYWFFLRWIDKDNWYACDFLQTPTQVRISKSVGSIRTTLLDIAGTAAVVGSVLKFRIVGNVMTMFIDDVAVGSVADSTWSGRRGLIGFGFAGFEGQTMDNFVGGSVQASDLPLGTVAVSDNFHRADSNPISGNWSGPAWYIDGLVKISSNQVVNATPNTFGSAYWLTPLPPDQEVSVTIQSTPIAGNIIDLSVRTTNMGSPSYAGQYAYDVAYYGTGNAVVMERFVNGVFTTIASTTIPALNIGDVIKLRAVGNTISYSVNGVVVLSAVDSSVTDGGYVAIETKDITFDSFTASGSGPDPIPNLTLV